MTVAKSSRPAAHLEFASDSTLLISFHGETGTETNFRTLSFFRELQLDPGRWPFENFHPAYASLLIDFDPNRIQPVQLAKELEAFLLSFDFSLPVTDRILQVPVRYGGDEGPDLGELSQLTGLSPQELIEAHSSCEYRVAFLGFSPGFPYLLGLPDRLHGPRKKSPRLKVPAGSVAIAGAQTGVYPSDSPGGWQIIGRTDLDLFDPLRDPPALFRPGDRVCFVPDATSEDHRKTVTAQAPPVILESSVLKAESAGFFSTLQDRGRFGWAHLGVSAGGAADPVALRIGQEILGNSEEACAIEMTAGGGTFTFLKETWFTVTGAECDPELDGQKIAMWSSIPVSAGQRLVIGQMEKNLRCYLHIYGGIGVAQVLQSRSTFVSAGWGGWQGRALRSGDVLPEGRQIALEPAYRHIRPVLKSLYAVETKVLRVTRGPQQNWFSATSLDGFFSQEFEVSSETNRLGLRLLGPSLEFEAEFKDRELVSEGVSNGAIQVSSGGQAMILFCEQRTTGGYPKIANVIRADWFRLGQLRPGQKIRFQEVDMEDAWKINQEFEDLLRDSVSEF